MLAAVGKLERAGIMNVTEGQKLSYELEAGRQGKTSAVGLKRV